MLWHYLENFITKMEDKIRQEYYWIPTRPKEKRDHRQHCCHSHKICRTSPTHDCYVDPAAFRQRAKMLHEILAVHYGLTLDDPGTCRCRESSSHGSDAAARFLRPIFRFLGGRCENDVSGLYRDLECPFDLLNSLFLKLESAHSWHRLVMVEPWLQELLEVNHSFWLPRPQEMCVSCRKWPASGSEAGMSDGKPKQHRPCSPRRKLQRCQPNLESLSELQSNIYQTADMDLPEKEAYQPGREEGHFASIQRLKSSLKMDLGKHQFHLTHIESRLSSLERRAEDVTRHLEKANLDLEDIKRGSVALQTLVDQKTSPVTEDLEDWDLQALDSLWEDVIWSGDPLQTRRVDPRRTGDWSHKPERSRPTAGGSREQWSAMEAGISQCQDQINVLLQQISQDIDQTEMDLNIAINQAYRG